MLNQFALPAWTSISADIVPEERRGRYFASRNLMMAIAGVVGVPLAGQIIKGVGGLTGYQINFALAFFIGLAATFFYSRIETPRRQEPVVISGKRLPLWERVRQRPAFLLFCIHAAVWNFALQIAAPFFNVYLVKEVGASAMAVGLVATVSTVASLPGQQVFGRLADRWGAERLVVWCGGIIPLAPLAWILVSQPWHPALINLFSGFLWAGYSLASFTYLLHITPDERRARYVALFNVVVGLSSAAGATLGGWVAETLTYDMVFLLSGLERGAAILLFVGALRWTVDGRRGTEDGRRRTTDDRRWTMERR
jgi:MFS family permease